MRQPLLVLILLGIPPLPAAQAQAPATPLRPVVDTLYGTPVRDPYRWLEDAGAEEVTAWFREQGAYARTRLDALPGRRAILERIREVTSAPTDISLPHEAGERLFFRIRRAGDPVARGYVRDKATGVERLLVDPATVGQGHRLHAALWRCLEPDHGFYEASGERLHSSSAEFHGGYGWRDLRQLSLMCRDR